MDRIKTGILAGAMALSAALAVQQFGAYAADANEYCFHDTFEDGIGDWEGRGGASVATGSDAYSGSKALSVSDRGSSWHGAMKKLDAHQFHPWEGGEGKVSSQYQICRVELAKQELAKQDKQERQDNINKAIRLLEECLEYPPHLGEGKLYGAQENDFYYLLGVAYDALGQTEKAVTCWQEATKGPQEPAAAMYYNDAKPDKIFYQGLALRKLGREDESHGRFYKLINYGKQHIYDKVVMDYFAVSLPDLLIWEDSLDTKNLIHCKYMLALGYYGMGDKEKGLRYLSEVENLDNNHQGIQQFRTLISQGV